MEKNELSEYEPCHRSLILLLLLKLHFIVLHNSVSPMLTLKRKSLYGFAFAQNACKINELWPHNLLPAELYYILMLCYAKWKTVNHGFYIHLLFSSPSQSTWR